MERKIVHHRNDGLNTEKPLNQLKQAVDLYSTNSSLCWTQTKSIAATTASGA